MRASHFKFKAQKLNEIRKPMPLNMGCINHCGMANADENKSNYT